MERSISFGTATEGSDLEHNTRKDIADNIDVNRIKDNVILKRETLKSAFETCFRQSQEEYNSTQKRKDRKIDDYFKHLFGISADNPQKTRNVITGKNGNKSYYENVIQIGDMFDTGIKNNPEAAEKAKQALMTYFNGYAKRNPHFYVFDAVIHMDESTPQLHLCYIPWASSYQKGMKIQHSHDKALKQMGFERHTDYVNHERDVFREICRAYGLEPREKENEKGRGHTYTTYEYNEKAEQIREADKKQREAAKKLREANMPSVEASVEPEKPIEASVELTRSHKRNGKQKPVEKPTEVPTKDISKILLEAQYKAHKEAVNNMQIASADDILKDLGLDSQNDDYDLTK